MSSGIASLHKILKDETRRKIVLLLTEKDALSYTELMETLGFLTTGLLNYHLKVLGDLLTKNEKGHYMLTEKGQLASRLLLEFPENAANGGQGKPTWWRKFWISIGVATTAFLALNLAMYFLGYINLSKLYQFLLWNFAAIAIAYMIQHISRDVLSKKTQLLLNKIAYTMFGAWIGLLIAFFGFIFLALASMFLHGPNIGQIEGIGQVWIATMIILIIISGKWGYEFGKKRGFKRPEPKFLGIPL